MSYDDGEVWLPRLLADVGLVNGTGEGRRMITQNAVSVDGEKIQDIDFAVKTASEVLLRVGKRKFCKVRFS